MTIRNLVFLTDYKNSLAENDLLEKHRLSLYKISTLFFLFLYLSFIFLYDSANWRIKELYYLDHFLFLSALLNYALLNFHKKGKITYSYSIILYFVLLHIVTYMSGGIQNSANAYRLCVILYTFMLLGKKMGLIFVFLTIINFLYFYYLSEYSNLIDDSLNKNSPFLIKIDYLVTFSLSAFIIWNQSSFIQKTHNEVVQNILDSSKKLITVENEKATLKTLVAENELKALRAQMNPHFTFNVMNSIQYYISNHQTDLAQNYLTKFSKLIRKVLDNSKENVVLLKDEIEALHIYLELEQLRFKEKFTFHINIEKQILTEQWYIPSMLIQPFVENAIKHGFSTEIAQGNITIDFSKKDTTGFQCIVTDNGMGRKKAAELKRQNVHTEQNKSYGIEITEERIRVFNSIHATNASVQIIDVEDGDKTGTKVMIELPIIEG